MKTNTFLLHSELAEAILWSVPALIADLDTGEIYWASETLEQMFGYVVCGELTGKNVDDLVPKRLRKRHEGHRASYATKPRARPMGIDLDLFGLREDGSEFPVYITLKPRVINGVRCVVAICFPKPEKVITAS